MTIAFYNQKLKKLSKKTANIYKMAKCIFFMDSGNTLQKMANLANLLSTEISLHQWFPTGRSLPQSVSHRTFCTVANSNLNSLLNSQIFRNPHINSLCYINKTKTRTDFCEVHIIYVIISNRFLLYNTVAINLIVKTRQLQKKHWLRQPHKHPVLVWILACWNSNKA